MASSRILEELNATDRPIRVIINQGRGFGHQRASITLIQRLRELGFHGLIDIRYHDLFPYKGILKRDIDSIGSVSQRLSVLIPGFQPTPISDNDKGWEMKHPALGKIRVTRLPWLPLGLPLDDQSAYQPYYEEAHLFEVSLTLCAGNDFDFAFNQELLNRYNTTQYIQLQPTDWARGDCFIRTRETYKALPRELRLSSEAEQSPRLALDNTTLTMPEKNILELCGRRDIHSQLVYGLYVNQENLDPTQLCSLLLAACLQLQQHEHKPMLLLFPQDIIMSDFFRRFKIQGKDSGPDRILRIDLTEPTVNVNDLLQGNNIVLAYVGKLQPAVFDYLLLNGTTLPPVIEGCNSCEICESSGEPFLHSSALYVPLKQYPVNEESQEMQELHCRASRCLETGNPDISSLVKYMQLACNRDPKLLAYHADRRRAFLARPEACQFALNTLDAQMDTEETLHIKADKPIKQSSYPVILWRTSYKLSRQTPEQDQASKRHKGPRH